jgi:hypothetical protein
MKRLVITILICFMGITQMLYAQTTCDRNLNEARNDYSAGNLYAIPEKLKECITSGFDKDQKIEAYRILALTYLNINQQDRARESLISLLKLKPDYQIIEADPRELRFLYATINTNPEYYVGVQTGLTGTFVNLLSNYSNSSIPETGAQNNNYKLGMGYTIGGQFMKPILPFLLAKAKVNFIHSVYRYQGEIHTMTEADPTSQNVSLREVNDYLQIGLDGRFLMDNYRYKPFFEAGFFGSYLANAAFRDHIKENTRQLAEDETTDRIDILDNRARFQYGINFSVGTMLKLGLYEGEIMIGANYTLRAPVQYDNINDRLTSPPSLDGYVDNDYQPVLIYISIGLTKPFYNFLKPVKNK